MSHWSLIKSFYCINLDKNPHRWNASVDEFIRVGIPYVKHIITHESEENRYLSFNRAHYDVIKEGYETGEPFCIFEDDIMFDLEFKKIEECSKQLPPDWDLLYLGANIIGSDTMTWQMPQRVSDNVLRLYNAWTSHAIVYSNKGAKWVLDNFDPDTFPVYDEWLRMNAMVQKEVYLISPMICYQRPGYSDVWKLDADNSGCHRQGQQWIKNNL